VGERLHSRGLAAGPRCLGQHPSCRGLGAHAMRGSGLPARWAARPRWARAGIALGGKVGPTQVEGGERHRSGPRAEGGCAEWAAQGG
jgi:hypothetical protein